MKYLIRLLCLPILIGSCKQPAPETLRADDFNSDFTIAFGSCNNQHLTNVLWPEIEKNHPNVWIWGGDNIYADTEDMDFLSKNYQQQLTNPSYADFIADKTVLGVWDDHDYGMNDGGVDYSEKRASQQLFLDFLGVPTEDERRIREGTYHARNFELGGEQLQVILLDTRYFRTDLSPDNQSNKRYTPNKYGEGTMLGAAQWTWLEETLKRSEASFTIIVSSIQFLSNQHGFESWGNMPHEVDRLEKLLVSTQQKRVILLSGDRHISEISAKKVEGLKEPLIDFTASGLTHTYEDFTQELNPYRISEVVTRKNFGLLNFDLEKKQVLLEIRGENNQQYLRNLQKYHP